MKTIVQTSSFVAASVAALLLSTVSSSLAQTTYRAVAGTTSVRLDTATLASAANLNLTGASSTGTPFDSTFQVGFPFVSETDFTFSVANGFAPVNGSIRHAGTVTFNGGTAQQVVLGNFRIGFDPTRIGGDRSGFFVENTVAPLGPVIVFDVKTGLQPAFTAASFRFGITNARLLVSSELGGFLQTNGFAASNLTGAEVGEARIDGRFVVATDAGRPELSIRGGKTIRSSARFVRIRGTASDDVALRRVEARIGSRPFRKVAGLRNWNLRVGVADRPQRISIRAIDASGNRSKVERVRVIRG